ncbi:MAG: XdhC family protein [Methylocystis sp.]
MTDETDIRTQAERWRRTGTSVAIATVVLSCGGRIAVFVQPLDGAGLELFAASYVGALGSRATNARRFERLAGAGVAREALSRLHAPIGLDIGALSPADIAVSILAEIVLERRRKLRRNVNREQAA